MTATFVETPVRQERPPPRATVRHRRLQETWAPIVIVIGPPGTGASRLAKEIARAWGGWHLDVRRRVARELRLGSADALPLEQATVAGALQRVLTGCFRAAPRRRPLVVDGVPSTERELDALTDAGRRWRRSVVVVFETHVGHDAALARFTAAGCSQPEAEARWLQIRSHIVASRRMTAKFHSLGYQYYSVNTACEVPALERAQRELRLLLPPWLGSRSPKSPALGV